MELAAKLRTKSPVWQYFGLAVDGDGKIKNEDEAICRLCKVTVMAKGSNTSNLQSHLKFAEIKQAKNVDKPTTSCGQIMIDVAMSKGEKYPRSSKQWQQLTDLVTHCLVKDMILIYSVDKPWFRRMLERFDPKYVLPTHKYFSKVTIPSLYARTRETVTSELQGVEYFAATADMWSSNTLEPYI